MSEAYEKRKSDALARARLESLAGRDIGDIPPVANSERKEKARLDLKYFCEEYFPKKFEYSWSDDHLRCIEKLQRVTLEGGMFALAMPRGNGKSTICEAGSIWACVYGHHRFVLLVGSDEGRAGEMLSNIKTEFGSNDLLLGDFPEVCYPIRQLEGQARKAGGQLHHGQRTQITWSAEMLTMPVIPGSRASGTILYVAGLTGNIRGKNITLPDGVSVRPTLAIIDDPQTDESARSATQVAQRERIINGAILGLAGPGKSISAVMPCTVITEGDLSSRFLNHDIYPEWQGERTKLVYAFPTNTALWDQYAEMRRAELAAGGSGAKATAFYRKNRAAMDAGAIVAWPDRKKPDELSAIQHAMNLKIRDERAFYAEYQNDPLPDTPTDDLLTAEEIAKKLNGHKRGVVPANTSMLTAMIDVQQRLLYYVVIAWEQNFTGHIIEYGSEPDQKIAYFTAKSPRHTLAHGLPGAGLEAQIYAGLGKLCERLIEREWRGDDDSVHRIGRCLIDANWGHSTDVVYRFCRQNKYASVTMPSHGKFVGASSLDFNDAPKKPNETVGVGWRMGTDKQRSIKRIVFDSNYFKSFLQARISVPIGDPGALDLFGTKSDTHRMISEHLTAEYRVRTEGRGRTVDEWKQRIEGGENHWLDCCVGACVAASSLGLQLTGIGSAKSRTRLKLSEMQGRRK